MLLFMWYYKIAVNISRGDIMKKCIRRSIMWTSIGFGFIMLCCILSMIYKFNYIDLAYFLIVIYYFISYLKLAKEI